MAFSGIEPDQMVSNANVYTPQEENHDEAEGMTTWEWDKAEGRVPAGTATGPDDIPMRLIKVLGRTSKLKLRQVIDQIIMGGNVPNDWKLSRMRLLFKGK